MGQMIVRQLDDDKLDRLRRRARAQKTSVEALAREAIHKAAEPTIDEKLDLVRLMQEAGDAAKRRGAEQTPGWILIREDRDVGH